jgi:hypothetical protein
MVGFLNAHGTSACINGFFLPLSFDEQDEPVYGRSWVSVEELAIYDPFDEEDIDHLIDMRESDGDTDLFGVWSVELDSNGIIVTSAWIDYDEFEPFDIKDWYYARLPEEDVESLAAEMAAEVENAELQEAKFFFPAWSGSNRTNLHKPHWSDKCILRACSLTYDKRRGKAHAK